MSFSSFLLLWAVKFALITCAATVMCLVARKASASFRNLVWLCALTAGALLPLGSLVTPRWSPAPVQAYTESIQRSVEPFTSKVENKVLPQLYVVSTVAPSPERSVSQIPSGPVFYGVIASSGLLWLLCTFIAGAVRIRRGTRHEALEQAANAIAREMRIARPVRVRLYEALSTPATWGVRRPTILLPQLSASWSEERLRVVLVHELAHVKRLDCLTLGLARVVLIAQWFNPFVWFAVARLRAEAEVACDDAVILSGSEPSRYAQELLDIAKAVRRQYSSLSISMARKPQVQSRLASILSNSVVRQNITRGSVTKAGLVSCALLLPLAALRPLITSGAAILNNLAPITTPPTLLFSDPQPIPANAVKAKGYSATLPTGTQVQLLGLTDRGPAAYTEHDLWTPNGGPWEGRFGNIVEPWRNYILENAGDDPKSAKRTLVLRIDSRATRSVSTYGFVPGVAHILTSPSGSSEGWDSFQDQVFLHAGANDAMVGILNFGTGRTEEYCFGIAEGGWDFAPPKRNTLVPREGQGIQIAVTHQGAFATLVGGKGETKQIKIADTDISREAVRVIPVNDIGTQIPAEFQPTGMEGATYDISATDAKRVSAFRIGTRPWTWIIFNGIHIAHPKTLPGLQVKSGDATGVSSNARAITSNGAIVEVDGIASTKAIGDIYHPDAWWRGDGKLMKSSESHFDPQLRVSDQDPKPILVSLKVVKLSPDGAKIIRAVVREGEETKAFDSLSKWLFCSSTSGYWTDVTPVSALDTRKISVIVGVANGPWQLGATMPFEPWSYSGERVTINLGTDPMAQFSTKTGKKVVSFNLMHDVLRQALRVVAVLSSGERKPIENDSIFAPPFETVTIPLKGKDATLDASKIVSLELETCPYEFVTIKNLPAKPAE